MPRRLALVLGALALLACCLDGTSGVPLQNLSQHPVKGVVGGTASFHTLIPPGKAVTQIEWVFQPESSQAHVIAEFTKGGFERPNPDDQFQQRLEKADDTTLRLQGLTKEDGGVYTAHVRFEGAEVQEQEFLLEVSDKNKGIQMLTILGYFSIIITSVLFLILLRRKQLLRKIKPRLNHLRRLRPSSPQESSTPSSPSGTELREGLAPGILEETA